MSTYQVTGYLSNSEIKKTVILDEMFDSNEAMDYAAVFHNIDEIVSIKRGECVKGIFIETLNDESIH